MHMLDDDFESTVLPILMRGWVSDFDLLLFEKGFNLDGKELVFDSHLLHYMASTIPIFDNQFDIIDDICHSIE